MTTGVTQSWLLVPIVHAAFGLVSEAGQLLRAAIGPATFAHMLQFWRSDWEARGFTVATLPWQQPQAPFGGAAVQTDGRWPAGRVHAYLSAATQDLMFDDRVNGAASQHKICWNTRLRTWASEYHQAAQAAGAAAPAAVPFPPPLDFTLPHIAALLLPPPPSPPLAGRTRARGRGGDLEPRLTRRRLALQPATLAANRQPPERAMPTRGAQAWAQEGL
jgi:hypothetical protein